MTVKIIANDETEENLEAINKRRFELIEQFKKQIEENKTNKNFSLESYLFEHIATLWANHESLLEDVRILASFIEMQLQAKELDEKFEKKKTKKKTKRKKTK